MKSEEIVLNEILPSSVKWSKIIKRGQTIQLKALGDNASLSAMFYNASNVTERFNSADTVKIQWNAFLGKEKVLFSEMGRVLFAITDDTTDGLLDTLEVSATTGSSKKISAARLHTRAAGTVTLNLTGKTS